MAAIFCGCARLQTDESLTRERVLSEAVFGSWRSAENKKRDRYRHPLETLRFFGVDANKRLIEITPGSGWYTEILAPLLAERGEYVAALNNPDLSSPLPSPWLESFRNKIKSNTALYGHAQIRTFDFALPRLGPPRSIDTVLTFRNIHNWTLSGNDQEMFSAIFTVLKPGGVLGVVEHRAKAGADVAATAQLGYLPQEYVISLAVSTGFILDATSEVNANPRDTTVHPRGVWSLPPTLVEGDVSRQEYLSVGESDRMTLRFTKPRD
jgi:predicted methyltransferase